MGKLFTSIDVHHREFMLRQKVFFVASAAPSGRINLSPKNVGALRLPDENAAVYLDRTGSGNETAAHLRADGRLTFMFCAFEEAPMILRLYGRGSVLPRRSAGYDRILRDEYGGEEPLGARQIIRLDVGSVQTSCGIGVPLFDYIGEREMLDRWAQAKGEAGLETYRREKNVRSLDGWSTGLLDDDADVVI